MIAYLLNVKNKVFQIANFWIKSSLEFNRGSALI